MTLSMPYFKKDRNVTTDNSYASLKQAEKLEKKKAAIFGCARFGHLSQTLIFESPLHGFPNCRKIL